MMEPGVGKWRKSHCYLIKKKNLLFREEVEQFCLGGAFSVGPPICGPLEAGKASKTKPLETQFLPQKSRAEESPDDFMRQVICCYCEFCRHNVNSKREDMSKDH